MDNGHAQCRKALSWNGVGSNLDFISCLNPEHPEPLRTNLNPFPSEHIIDTVCQCWSVLQENTTMHKQVSPENAGPSVSAVVRVPAAFGMSWWCLNRVALSVHFLEYLEIPASCKSYNLGPKTPKRWQTILLLTHRPGTEWSLHSFRALWHAEN